MTQPHLPAGFVARPVTMDDLEAAVALFNRVSMAESGREPYTLDDTRVEWQSPNHDIETDTTCMLAPDGEMVAYGEIWDNPPHVVVNSWGRVDPAYTGQGLGTALMAWAERRAAQTVALAPAGARVVLRQGVLQSNVGGKALLIARGYTHVRNFYRMFIDFDGPPPEPAFPEGITVRTMTGKEDLPAIIAADQDAFRDHWGYVQRPPETELENWSRHITQIPDFDPNLWFLAVDTSAGGATGEVIAGLCLCWPHSYEDHDYGWVGILGVRRPWRRRGLGLALLQHSFGEFYRRGQPGVGLAVDADSLTGATRLYEKAGMYVRRESYTFEKVLREGEDLTTQALNA